MNPRRHPAILTGVALSHGSIGGVDCSMAPTADVLYSPPHPMAPSLLKLIPQWTRSPLKSLILDLVRSAPAFAQQRQNALQAQQLAQPITTAARSPLIGMISGPADLASRSQDLLSADLKTH